MGMPNPMACAAPCAWPMPVAAYVGMRLREASERGDRRRAVSSRCGTWAPGPVCSVWIAADADGSGSAGQDQKVQAGNNKAARENADSIRHVGGIEIKSLDAPYIACNAAILTFNRIFVKLEQKLMAPADQRLGGDVVLRDGEHTGIMVPSSQRRRAKVRSARSPSSPTSAAGPGSPHLLVRVALTSIETLVAQARIALNTALKPPS